MIISRNRQVRAIPSTELSSKAILPLSVPLSFSWKITITKQKIFYCEWYKVINRIFIKMKRF